MRQILGHILVSAWLFKESTKPNVNINMKGQKVPDDEDININKIAQGDSPRGGRNTADITAKQMPKQAKRTHY